MEKIAEKYDPCGVLYSEENFKNKKVSTPVDKVSSDISNEDKATHQANSCRLVSKTRRLDLLQSCNAGLGSCHLFYDLLQRSLKILHELFKKRLWSAPTSTLSCTTVLTCCQCEVWPWYSLFLVNHL